MRPKILLLAAALSMAAFTPTVSYEGGTTLPDDDPYKPRHRSKGEKKRNKSARHPR